jgi:hypothetical protein
MRNYFFLVLLICFTNFNCRHSKKIVKNCEKKPIIGEVIYQINDCSNLDSLLQKNWKLSNLPQAAYFHLYQRNDSLINNYILKKFNNCIIGKNEKFIINKFGEPSYKDQFNIYYKCIIDENSIPICLKFWINSDTIASIRYQNCEY